MSSTEGTGAKILEILDDFRLGEVPPELVDSLLQGEFTSDFDREQLNVLTKHVSVDLLSKAVKLLNRLIGEEKQNAHHSSQAKKKKNNSGLWGLMTGKAYSHRALLGVLFHLIQQRRSEQAFVSATAYLLLLQIPGSMAYNIFHPLIFRAVLYLLKSWQSLSGKDLISTNK